MPRLPASNRLAAELPLNTGWNYAYWADDPLWANPGNGNAISSWRDAGPTSSHLVQATGSKQPIFRSSVAGLNNRAGIDFDGVDDILAVSTNMENPQAIIWIGKRDGAGGGQNERCVALSATGAGNPIPIFMSVNGSVATPGRWAGFDTAAGLITSSVSYDTNIHMIVTYHINGTGYMLVDTTLTTASTTGANKLTGISVGGSSTAADCGNITTAFVGIMDRDLMLHTMWGYIKQWVNHFYGIVV